MNNLLEEYYVEILKELTPLLESVNSREKGDKATNPLLIKTDENYMKSDYKIMLFGQETNYWYSEVNDGLYSGSLEELIDLYNNFFLEEGCYDYGRAKGGFWRGVQKFFNKLESKKSENVKLSYVWNNVIKIGRLGRGRPNFYSDIKQVNKKMIEREIEILKPDLLLFFSGPYRDDVIKDIFGVNTFSTICGYNTRQIGIFECYEAIPSVRTYHPGYMLRIDYNKYYEDISKYIVDSLITK